MEFDQLQALVALAQERNFSRAAHRLYITQPAVSLKIKALETELGVVLFERTPRDVRITEAGALLLERAQWILREQERAREDLRELQGLGRGTLRIACSENISRYYLAPVVAKYLAKYPQVELIIQNMPSPASELAVARGDVDVAFTLLPLDQPDLQSKVVLAYRDVGVCSKQHPLAKRQRVTLVDLAKHRLLLLNPSTKSHQLIAADFARQSLRPKDVLELGGAETQKEFARVGLGVGVVPGYTMETSQPHEHVFQITGLTPRQIAWCHRKNTHSKALDAFLSLTTSRISHE